MIRFVVSPDATCASVEDGAVVLNMRTKRYYSLNETGAAIWRLLEEGAAFEAITRRLVELFAVERKVAEDAVTRLLQDLTAESLIRVEGA
jgi:hypothetical protein